MNKFTIGIIGGTGQMGVWFKRFFVEAGHKVLIAGRQTELTYKQLAKQSDIVILSVPIDAVEGVCNEIGSILNQDQLLMDLCSLKENVLKHMLNCTSAQVVGAHPLFGPFVESIKGQNVIICQGRGTSWLDWIESELKANGAVVTRVNPVEHDKKMAVIQGLTHFLTICTGRILQKMNIPLNDIALYATPIFKLKVDIIGRLFAQDISLYSKLISQNEYFPEVLETFLSVVEEGKKNLLCKQNDNGEKFMKQIQDFLGDACNECLERSNETLNHFYKNPK